MKRVQNVVQRLVVCGLALTMVTTVAAQTAVQSTAKVVRIKGNARFTTGNNVYQPLRVGALLKPGTVIQTASDGSYVDLVLGNEEATAPTAVGMGGNMSAAAAPPPGSGSGAPAPGDQNIVRVFENSTLAIDKLTTMDTGADTVS